MKKGGNLIIRYLGTLSLVTIFWAASATYNRSTLLDEVSKPNPKAPLPEMELELPVDSLDPIWPNQDDPYPNGNPGGVSIPLPDNITYTVEYNPVTGQYEVVQNIGDTLQFRSPSTMSLEEYLQYDMRKTLDDWWTEQQEELDEENRSPVIPTLEVGGKLFETIFGGNEIEFKMDGSAELIFGVNISKTDNPRIPIRQRRISTFDFNQRIQMNLTGNIGTKMQLKTNFNTEATFDFENTMNLGYEGSEDEIIKNIEAGNVTLPLNSTLIQGSQSLFGLKIETQWGRLRNTSVFSQQKGERKEIEVEGGAQTQKFEISADNYDANRHFFLSNWFRDQYDQALESLPIVNSGVNITRIEVWVVNTQANTQDVRNVIALTDLGEQSDFMFDEFQVGTEFFDDPEFAETLLGNPSNTNNDLYYDMTGSEEIMGFVGANQAIGALSPLYEQGIHYERVGNARKLTPSEYTYNSRLGFISLRQSLNNAEVLAVSYEYTLNGDTYKVGTLSQDGFTAPNALILKMLKATVTNVNSPIWDLMMKNVYNIGAFGVSSDDFRLNVWYNNPATGVPQNYIPYQPLDDKLLMQVLNMDKLDVNGMPNPDGVFDYVDNAATQGGLINSQNGRIYLPNVEPFGGNLSGKIEEGFGGPTAEGDVLIDQIVFQELYDSTKTAAQQIPSKNRFMIQGQFQSSSTSEISLNALNIPQGSVTVTAGGNRLIENQDYTVDYNLGRVRIINDGILQSGTPIKISLESNSLFSIQTKTMLGSRFDYEISDNFKAGATILNLRERPLTQKVNIGDEPINNTILGTDLSFQRESEWLTRLVDKIPGYDTKAPSNIDFSAEAAYLIPGHSRAVGKEGNAYVDDFEGSQSTIDIRSINQWFLASTPRSNPLFPEGNLEDSLDYNYNRAKLSWYIIDPQFWLSNGLTDGQVSDEVQSDNRMREVLENEVFPNKELPPGVPPNIPTLDLTFYPEERGPYNYVPFEGSGPIPGLDADGNLLDPADRWGGIQRALTTTDFEASNIEFIQFWLMDPFNEDSENTNGGKLYFNLGNVSEDVLNDSQLSYENGYPTSNNPLPTLESTWGNYPDPSTFNVVNAFENTGNNDPNIATYGEQDIGIDGLNNAAEADFFNEWLTGLQGVLNPDAYARIASDPSADDFEFFRRPEAEGQDILFRYKDFNGYEDNSNTTEPNGYTINSTTIPNTEDINQDLTLNTIESYYQYEVDLTPNALGEGAVGSNYITDSFEAIVDNLPDGTAEKKVRWYQFKIPVKEFDSRFGQISDFRSIRYIRMFMKGWSEEATLRFARLELVRGEWRRYAESLLGPGEFEPGDPDQTTFTLNAVNLEENGDRTPVKYVIPPGIIREVDVGAANFRNLNEQSLSMAYCNLKDGDARGAYRTVNFDMRMYKRLKMFVHSEAPEGDETSLEHGDVTCFVRLGSDFDENYYEYEIPLYNTPHFTGDEEEIWPEFNDVDIELKSLQSLKLERPNGFSPLLEYARREGKAEIKVKGNPNLANVVIVMVGVRNRRIDDNPFVGSSEFDVNEDGLAKCGEIWVNELRLTDFNEDGGWAALARMNATLADFGTLQVAGNISKPGFGGLEQTVQERQRETIMGFDASTTLQMGKLFPDAIGLTLPVYLGYSENVSTPQFDPLSPDVELDDRENLTPERRKKSQTYSKRRSINFTNVRINPQGGNKDKKKDDKKDGKADPDKKDDKKKKDKKKSKNTPFYHPSNFSFTYAYNELYQRDINTAFRLNKEYNGQVNYAFSNKPKEVKPFSKIGFIKKSPYLKWVKDFNFYTGIKSFSFNTGMDRTYETSRVRNNTLELFGFESDVLINTQVLKTWNWNRAYSVKYDITKSLGMDFNANTLSLVREPVGVIDKEDTEWYAAYRDSVWNEIQGLGERTNYNHAINVNYKVPFDKFPLIDFMSGDARYAGTYRWDRAPFSQDSLGGTIQNSRNITLNAQANFLNLYNKVPLLKDINSGKSKKKSNKKEEEDDKTKKDGFGKDEEPKKEKSTFNPLHELLRLMMVVRNVSGSYTRNEGLLLPGYGLTPEILGMDENFEGPGWGFLFGQQNTNLQGDRVNNYALEAANQGWFLQNPNQNQISNETYSETWNLRANLEPIKHFKVELTGTRQVSRNGSSFFRFDTDEGDFVFDSPTENGSFSTTVITWGSAFDEQGEDFESQTFRDFLDNRTIVSSRLNDQNFQLESPELNGYYDGYGSTAQDVVIPAFIAAYTGVEANSVSLDAFKTKMAPNWRITYDGLSKNKKLKKKFKQFSIKHTYRSTMTTNYVFNLAYGEDGAGQPTERDESENWVSRRQISTVSISEQMSPLIGIDMRIKTKKKNDPSIKLEWKRDRTISLGLANYQVTETSSNSLVIGVGYKFTDVPNPFGRAKGSRLPIPLLKDTDLELRADLTIRDNVTVIRKMVERQNQVTAGQKIISIKTYAQMKVSEKLDLRLFYDHQLTRPKISTSFPTSNINSGISLRFTLS